MPTITTFLLKTSGVHSIRCAYGGDETGCFHPLKMDRVEIHSIGALAKHENKGNFAYLTISEPMFPKEVTSIRIQTDKSLSLTLPQLMSELLLEIENVKYAVKLSGITVTEKFIFGYSGKDAEIGLDSFDTGIEELEEILKKKVPYEMLSDIYNNPSLRNNLVLKDFPSKLLPITVPCLGNTCPRDNPQLAEVYNGNICAKENEILNRKNPSEEDLRSAESGTIWYRAFMVDLSALIDKIGEKTSDLTVIVNTYYVYISESRKINFKLQVYYTVMATKNDISETTKAVIYRNWYDEEEKPEEKALQDLPAFATTLARASKVDAVFMLAYAKCTMSVIGAYREKSYFTDLYQSKQWEMYRQFPKIVDEYVADDPLDANRARAIHALVTDYFLKLVEEDRSVSKVPYLSMNLQGESTEILLQIARDLQTSNNQFIQESQLATIQTMTKENLKTILDAQDVAQINALEISRQKANSLGEISKRRRDDIQVELNKVSEALNKLNSVSLDAEKEVTKATSEFEAGAKRRKIEAYAEVALAVAGTLISMFSGSFDPNKIANAAMKAKQLAQKLTQLAKIMQMVGKLMKKLKNIKAILGKVKTLAKSRIITLVSKLKELTTFCSTNKCSKIVAEKAKSAYNNLATPISQELNDKKIASYELFMNRATKIKDVGDGLLAFSLKDKALKAGFDPMPGFDPSEHMKAIEEGKGMNVADVVQWDMTRDQVEGLLDASLSAEVPETTSYKAALFKFTTVGKAITQLQIDEAKLGNDYATADLTYLKHIEDYTVIDTKLTEIRDASEKRKDEQAKTIKELQKIYTDTYSKREETLFWESFLTKLELVSNNVEFCNAYKYFHLESCPPELQFNVLDSLEKITQVQTQLLLYSKRELQSLYPPPQAFYKISTLFEDEKNCECVNMRPDGTENSEAFHAESIPKCFPGRQPPFIKQDFEDIKKKHLLCNMKDVDTFKNEKMLSWSIAINSELPFKNYERVRIDKIMVYLHGAKTDNGKITIDISNAGVSQDRFKGRIYKFYGEPWLREFTYYDKNNKKGITVTDEREKKGAFKPSIIVSTEVHKQFEGIFRTPTAFSTWTIQIAEAKNPGLDLSELEKIEVTYSGSFIIGSTNYSTYDLEGFPKITTVESVDVDGGNTIGDNLNADLKGQQRVSKRVSKTKKTKKIKRQKKRWAAKIKNIYHTPQKEIYY